jgi:hypothetical protein
VVAAVDPVIEGIILEAIAWNNAANIGVKLLDARDAMSAAESWSFVEETVSTLNGTVSLDNTVFTGDAGWIVASIVSLSSSSLISKGL